MGDSKLLYLNQEAVMKARRSGRRRAVIGGVLFAFFAIGYVDIFMDVGMAAVSDAKNIAGTMMFLMIVILILTPEYLLFNSGFQRLVYSGRALKYAEIFAGDKDGFLLCSEVAEMMKIPEKRVAKDVKELLRREYIKKVRIANGNPACILLADSAGDRWNQSCYLYEDRMISENTSSLALIVIAGMFVISFLVYLPMMVVMAAETGDRGNVTFLMSSLVMYGSIAFMGIRVIRNRSGIKRTGIYNQQLEESSEAEVPVKSLADAAGIRQDEVVKDIRWLFGKQIMKDCRLDMRKEPSLQLSDIQNGEAEFTAQECPGCGATSRIRAGRVGKCRYCGHLLTAPLKSGARAGQSKVSAFCIPPGTYIDPGVKEKLLKRRNLFYLIGIILAVEIVICLGIYGGTFDTSAVLFLPWPLVLLVVCLVIVRSAVNIGRNLELAGSCDYLFGQSRTSRISLEEISEQTGVDEKETSRCMSELFRRNLFRKCQLEGDSIILTDHAHSEQAYIHTECKNCGASLTIKRGFVSVCRYCGSFIDEKGVTHHKDGGEKSVVLQSVGVNKGAVISYLHDVTGMGVNELEEILTSLPVPVIKTGAYGAARIRQGLRERGAEAELR